MITGLAPLWKCAVHLGVEASAVRRMEVMGGWRGGEDHRSGVGHCGALCSRSQTVIRQSSHEYTNTSSIYMFLCGGCDTLTQTSSYSYGDKFSQFSLVMGLPDWDWIHPFVIWQHTTHTDGVVSFFYCLNIMRPHVKHEKLLCAGEII